MGIRGGIRGARPDAPYGVHRGATRGGQLLVARQPVCMALSHLEGGRAALLLHQVPDPAGTGNRDQAEYHLNKIAQLAGTGSAEYRSLSAAMAMPPGTGLVY